MAHGGHGFGLGGRGGNAVREEGSRNREERGEDSLEVVFS